MSGAKRGKGSGVNVATVLMSAGIAAVISAVIVTIGVVGMLVGNNGSETTAQPTVVNLGAAQTAVPGAPAAGNASTSVSGSSEVPAAPAAPAAGDAPAATTGNGAQAPAQTQAQTPTATPTSSDAAPQNQTPSLNGARTEYLYVRSDRPTARTMEWQFAAFWNPRLSMEPKLAVTYQGNTAKVRKQMTTIMQSSQMYDFFSIRGSAVGQPQISGNQMTVSYQGLMAGFPIQTLRYHYVRENGLWKFDWKQNCREIKCMGNPDFGY